MSRWRQLGFVPDSDADDDDISSGTSESSAGEEAAGHSSKRLKLDHSSLRRKCAKCMNQHTPRRSNGSSTNSLPASQREICGPLFPSSPSRPSQHDDDESFPSQNLAPHHEISKLNDDSTASSELSELDELVDPSDANNVLLNIMSPISSNETNQLQRSDHDDEGTHTGRALRTRKAIQVHPYLIEGQNYRSALRNHGLQPVKVTGSLGTGFSRQVVHDESQQSNGLLDPQDLNSSQDHNGPSIASLSSSNLMSDASSSESSLQDESETMSETYILPDLPGLQEVLQARVERRRTKSKRQKFRLPKSYNLIIDKSTENSLSLPRSLVAPNGASPVREQKDRSSQARRTLRTPVADDDLRLPGQSSLASELGLVDLRSGDATELSTPQLTYRTSSASEDDSSGKSVNEVRAIQKRVRGVLPASWVKLDHKAQIVSTNHVRLMEVTKTSLHETRGMKGVAVRVSKAGSSAGSGLQPRSDTVNLVTDRSSSVSVSEASDTELESRPTAARQKGIGNSSIAPTNRRRYANSETVSLGIHASHQSRLTDAGFAIRQASKAKNHRPRRHKRYQPRTPASSRLGILDLIEAQDQDLRHLPDFVKIARRESKRRVGKGRAYPRNKVIRLPTEVDTNEALNTLRHWQRGALVNEIARPRSNPISRMPLREIDANIKAPARNLTDNKITSAVPTNQPSPKPHAIYINGHRSKGNRRLQGGSTKFSTHLKKSRLWSDPTTNSHSFSTSTFSNSSNEQHPLRSVSDVRNEAISSTFLITANRINIEDLRIQTPGLPGDDSNISFPAPNEVLSSLSPVINRESVKAVRRKKPRKRPPRRLDDGLPQYRQNTNTQYYSNGIPEVSNSGQSNSDSNFFGSDNRETEFSTDFDVSSLQPGTFFHQSTFLGSGEFEKILRLVAVEDGSLRSDIQHNKTNDPSCSPISIGPSVVHDVSNLFERALDDLNVFWETRLLQENRTHNNSKLSELYAAFRALISSFPRIIFSSSVAAEVDKLGVLNNTFSQFIQRVTDIARMAEDDCSTSSHHLSPFVRLLTYVFVLQSIIVLQFGRAPTEAGNVRATQELRKQYTNTILRLMVNVDRKLLRRFLQTNYSHVSRERGIRDDEVLVEAIVLVNVTLEKIPLDTEVFWEIVDKQIYQQASILNHFQHFEDIFERLFLLLPLVQFNEIGLLKRTVAIQPSTGAWGVVRLLLQRMFDFYTQVDQRHISTFNAYIRTCLTRCYILVSMWGWERCDNVLGHVFDYFARHDLALLRHEHSYGSAAFIKELAGPESIVEISVNGSDRSFHIFLKVLAINLLKLNKKLPEKKLRSITWRYVPNHGRNYQKDQPLKREDADALQNHHDLLCTLYCVSLPTCRPRVELIQGLVDHSSSHLEACRLNIMAWGVIADFQVTSDEPLQHLQPLGTWCSDMLHCALDQYLLAETEAKRGASELRNDSHTERLIQTTLIGNQKRILRSLDLILWAIKNSMKKARDSANALTLLRHCNIDSVLFQSHASRKQLQPSFSNVLDIVLELVKVFDRERAQTANISNVDSQDYGEWISFEEDDQQALSKPQEGYSLDFLLQPFGQVLSNIFGADDWLDSEVYQEFVKVWASLARVSVSFFGREWISYVDCHHHLAWRNLRDTRQSRIYSGYFYSLVIQSADKAIGPHIDVFILEWILSLLEESSRLRYQHLFTVALLNVASDHAQLHNLPVLRSDDGTHYITISELRERRLMIMSTYLENLRAEYDAKVSNEPDRRTIIASEYNAILRQLMLRMQRNHQDLPSQSALAGEYVTFLHSLLQLFQQYTSELCPVDKYFLDPATFPLPRDDPTYVIGRMKSYESKLGELKNVKQLCVFVYALSERSALGGHLGNLTDQLYQTITSSCQATAALTVGAIIIQATLPAYLEISRSLQIGWIFVLPVVRAIANFYRDAFLHLDAAPASIFEGIQVNIASFLSSTCDAIQTVIENMALLLSAPVLTFLVKLIEGATAATTVLDYARGRAERSLEVTPEYDFLDSSTRYLSNDLSTIVNKSVPEPYIRGRITESTSREAFEFCKKEYFEAASNCWTSLDDNEFQYTHGASVSHLTIRSSTISELQNQLKIAISDFKVAVAANRHILRSVSCGGRGAHQIPFRMVADVFI